MTCICGAELPEAPLCWGARRFCSMACFSAWYIASGSDGSDGAPEVYRAYAAHVGDCPTCARAELAGDLCRVGGALFDALDDDPTEPGVPHV